MDLNQQPAPKSHHTRLLTSVELRCPLSDFIRISCGSFAESCGFVLNLRKPSIYEIIYNGFLNLLGCVRRGELRSGSSHDPGPTRDLRSYVVKFYSFIVWMSVIVLISVRSVDECAQAAVAAGMTKFAKSLCFDLPYALSGDTEVLADLFKRMLGAVLQSKPHLDDALFTRRQCVQHLLCHFLYLDIDDRVGG